MTVVALRSPRRKLAYALPVAVFSVPAALKPAVCALLKPNVARLP
jgi:hypothetical protein